MSLAVPFAFSFNAGQSLQKSFTNLVAYLPNILGAIVILVIGYVIAKVVRTVVTKLLERAKVDQTLHSGHSGQYVERISPGASPARLIAGVVFWAIMIYVISAAVGALKIPALTAFMNTVFNYLPNVIAAVLIFVIAGAVAGGLAALVQRTMGDTPTGRIVRTVAPGIVMAISVFMVLTQLKIAPQIVMITYGALMFALALGAALAFGLGGRQVAADMVQNAYDQQRDQIRSDMQTGRDRGRQQAQEAQSRLQGGGNGEQSSSTRSGQARGARVADPSRQRYEPPPERR